MQPVSVAHIIYQLLVEFIILKSVSSAKEEMG